MRHITYRYVFDSNHILPYPLTLAPSTHPLRIAPFLQPLRPSLLGVFSGKSLEGGLGGTLVLSRKIHFLFLISFPQRNLNRGFHSYGLFAFPFHSWNPAGCEDIPPYMLYGVQLIIYLEYLGWPDEESGDRERGEGGGSAMFVVGS